MLITEDYSDQGYIYLAITAADQSNMTAMHFFVDSTDADILIPEGVYPINKSYRAGTVLGNVGPNDQNQIATPFYATINPHGYLSDIYMWVKGTVTVLKKNGVLYLEVNALNSYDVPIHIIYDGSSSTAVIEVFSPENQSIKYIKDGQVIIQKNGVEYNMQGIRLLTKK